MRIKALILWVLLIVALAGVEACFSGAQNDQEKPAGPVFDHKGHLARGVGCDDCHGDGEVAWKAKPEFETCQMCHEEIDPNAPEEKRATQFYDAEQKPAWTQRGAQSEEILFDHKAHVARGVECRECHGDIADSTAIPERTLVTMQQCIACHEERTERRSDRCEDCHQRLRKDVAPPSHRAGWMRTHGIIAKDGGFDPFPAECEICHERSTCDTCHIAEKPSSHTNLFRTRTHGVMASMDRDSCRVCHQDDACATCHQDNPPRSHRGSFGAPFNRHCQGCHLPLESGREEGCGVCHRSTPSHALAPPRPGNPAHALATAEDCRSCHSPMPHPDNGQSCFHCHE